MKAKRNEIDKIQSILYKAYDNPRPHIFISSRDYIMEDFGEIKVGRLNYEFSYEDWVGIEERKGDILYNYNDRYWDEDENEKDIVVKIHIGHQCTDIIIDPESIECGIHWMYIRSAHKGQFCLSFEFVDDNIWMNSIKKARENAGISRAEMSRIFEIPIRTLEDWEANRRKPAKWAEKLIIEKLRNFKTK